MTTVTTKSGFTCDVDEVALDNMELLDVLADLADGDVLAVPKFARFILHTEDKKRLYEHLRTEDGRVPTDRFSAELLEIFTTLGEAKK